MKNLTFPCNHCGKHMGIGLQYAGKAVRCPHCRQVLTAPTVSQPTNLDADNGSAPPAAEEKPVAPKPAPVKPTPVQLPKPDVLNKTTPVKFPVMRPASEALKAGTPPPPKKEIPELTPRQQTESAESIFSEADEEDDSVFSSGSSLKPVLAPPSSKRALAPLSDPVEEKRVEIGEDSEPTLSQNKDFLDEISKKQIEGPSSAGPSSGWLVPQVPEVPAVMTSGNPAPASSALQSSALEPSAPVETPKVPTFAAHPPAAKQILTPAPQASGLAPTKQPPLISPSTQTPPVSFPGMNAPYTPQYPPTQPPQYPPNPQVYPGAPPGYAAYPPQMPGPYPYPQAPIPPQAPYPPQGAELPAAKARPSPVWKALFILLSLYSVAATAAATWAFAFAGAAKHPFSIIPDFFGEYDKATRRKVGQVPRQFLNQDDPIPPELRVSLGGTLNVGDLSVAPIAVEERRVSVITKYVKSDVSTSPRPLEACLALRVKIKNNSQDIVFCPVDPAFQPKFKARPGAGQLTAASGLYLGRATRFLGGPVEWPFGPGIDRVYVEGQEADDKPLEPGSEREYLIFSADGKSVVDAVRASDSPIMWKIMLRRGLETYRSQDVSVSALLGVEFHGSQVKKGTRDEG